MTAASAPNQEEAVRALLPGLQYLATEAQRAGLVDVSQILVDALSRISRWTTGADGGHSPPFEPASDKAPAPRRSRQAIRRAAVRGRRNRRRP